jgi:hypothetical protein
MHFVAKINIFFGMICVVHYSLISQAFSHSIIMWTSYPWLIVGLNLTYTSYCFTLLHCNVALSNFTFDIYFSKWSWTWKFCEFSNFHSLYFFWNYFHPKTRLLPIIIQKFIHVSHSSKYFMFFVIVIHVHVVFIRHNCFGINFIHTFQLDKSFIQIICLCAIIIQKVHWCSIFIQTFHPFFEFHPCTCGKIFSMSFLCGIGIF